MAAENVFSEADVDRALPSDGFLKKYVEYAKNCTDAHAGYHLAGGLSVLAQTIPLDLHMPFGSNVYGNLFNLVVGPSSRSRKSSSIGVARDLLKDAVPTGLGEQPGSREALIDGLRMNPRQLQIYGEFGAFLALTERGYLMPLKTAYTEAYDSTPISRSLVRHGVSTETSADPRLSILAGVTVEYLERHTEPVDWTGGFFARFLAFYAETRERTFTVPPGDPAGRQWLIDYLKNLNEGFQAHGSCLGFSAGARKLWDEWYYQMNNAEVPREVEGAVHRGPMHGLRIALLLAWDYGMARSGEHWYITERELEPAKAIVNLHTQSVIRIASHLAPTPDMRIRRDILRILHEAKGRAVPLGTLTLGSKQLSKKVGEVIATLLEEQAIFPVAGSSAGGRIAYRIASEDEFRKAHPEMFGGQHADDDAPPPDNILQFPGNAGGSNGSSVPEVGAAVAASSPQTSSGGPALPPGAIGFGNVGGTLVPVFSPPAVVAAPTFTPGPLRWDSPAAESRDSDADEVVPVPPPSDPFTF